MKPTKIKEMELTVMGVTVTVKDATYYPPERETRIDPAEPEWAEWDHVFVGAEDITEMFEYKPNRERLHEAILIAMEE